MKIHGSSPRAWGIPPAVPLRPVCGRFIPTCVGNTFWKYLYINPITVHPHVRGEYDTLKLHDQSAYGSSPRAWGILTTHSTQNSSIWFIPTCVGNTSRLPSPLSTRPVHPHVRGEYVLVPVNPVDGYGSSPRAWGIPGSIPQPVCPLRFIPTCVGNTRNSISKMHKPAVHPHVRGEY